MKTLIKAIGAFVLLVLIVTGVAVFGAYPTKWVVNYLFTSSVLLVVFGTSQIGFWQALWLNVLCGFLFKSSVVPQL